MQNSRTPDCMDVSSELSSAFVLLIVDADEPGIRIYATINCGAYIRAPHLKTCLAKSKYIKTESADQLNCRTDWSAPLFFAA